MHQEQYIFRFNFGQSIFSKTFTFANREVSTTSEVQFHSQPSFYIKDYGMYISSYNISLVFLSPEGTLRTMTMQCHCFKHFYIQSSHDILNNL